MPSLQLQDVSMKSLLLLVLSITSLTVWSQTNHYPTEEVRFNIMEALTGLDSTTFDRYKALFPNQEEIDQIIAQIEGNEEEKARAREMVNEETLKEYMDMEFDRLIQKGEIRELDWDKIEYEDFLYSLAYYKGLKMMAGRVYFREGEHHFEIRMQAVLVNDVYRLVELENVRFSNTLYPNQEPEGEERIDELHDEMVETEVETGTTGGPISKIMIDLDHPDDLRRNIMQVLNGFDSTRFDAYKTLFATENEVEQMIDEMRLSEEEKKDLKEMGAAVYNEEGYKGEFMTLLEESAAYGIHWDNIEYNEFLYKLRRTDGVKELRGTLHFSDGEQHYEMRVWATYFNGHLRLLELEQLRRSSLFQQAREVEVIEEEPVTEVAAPPAKDPFLESAPSKRKTINELVKLFDAISKRDYKAFITYVEGADTMTVDAISEEMTRLEKELTVAGITLLGNKGILGSVLYLYGAYGANDARDRGLSVDQCFAIYVPDSKVECRFTWNGTSIRFYRIAHIVAE